MQKKKPLRPKKKAKKGPIKKSKKKKKKKKRTNETHHFLAYNDPIYYVGPRLETKLKKKISTSEP